MARRPDDRSDEALGATTAVKLDADTGAPVVTVKLRPTAPHSSGAAVQHPSQPQLVQGAPPAPELVASPSSAPKLPAIAPAPWPQPCILTGLSSSVGAGVVSDPLRA